jgi:hypothetical protein
MRPAEQGYPPPPDQQDLQQFVAWLAECARFEAVRAIDEIIEMANQLACLGGPTKEQAEGALVYNFEIGQLEDVSSRRCPHCKMIERLKQLKAEQGAQN